MGKEILTPAIVDELRARFDCLATALIETDADGEVILAHIVSDSNRAEIAGFFLQEAIGLHLEMLAAYERFLLSIGVSVESDIPTSKFAEKLFEGEET